jgi:glutamine synthetase
VDFSGNILSKTVGVKELLNNTHVSWNDGISINGQLIDDYKNIEGNEWLVILPDPSTFRVIPFTKDGTQKAGAIMCSIKNFKFDTRNILKQTVEYVLKSGFCPVSGTQLIYWIDDTTETDYYKTTIGCASNVFNNDLVDNILKSEIDIEYYLQYGGNYNRIDFVPDIVDVSADKLTLSKWYLSSLALAAKIDVKLINSTQQFLSSCPVHLSLWDKNKQNNLFFNENDKLELSPIGYKFINGILYHYESIMAIVAATSKNAILRYIPVFSTERDNSAISVPMYFKEKQKGDRIGWSKRCIFNGGNSDCNIYLLQAVLLYAGIYGIENDLTSFSHNKKRIYYKKNLIHSISDNNYFREKLGSIVVDKIVQILQNRQIKFDG